MRNEFFITTWFDFIWFYWLKTRFLFCQASQIILKFHNGGDTMYENFNQGKTNELSYVNERKRAQIRSTKCCYRNIMNTYVYRINKCFWKESFYGMIFDTMLSYAMVWHGRYGMPWDFNAMLWYFYAILCYGLCCKI